MNATFEKVTDGTYQIVLTFEVVGDHPPQGWAAFFRKHGQTIAEHLGEDRLQSEIDFWLEKEAA